MPAVESTRRSYDRVAAHYAEELGDELRHKPLDRALLGVVAELAQHGVVLDLGCGPGQAMAHLSGHGVPLLGLDLSPAMCVLARQATSQPVCAADMTALPLRSGSCAGVVCLYAVIHLDESQRAMAYAELARVLRPGGHALVSFHTSDADIATGQARTLRSWWGQEVDLTFRFLDPAAETGSLAAAGLELVARVDREPYGDVEHPSQRSYLLVRRS